MHDVIVVGARCAGAPTAMLLARAGLDVLLVDRARFPSDMMSTHYIQPEGMLRLASWGLLGDLMTASDTPRVDVMNLQFGSIPFTAEYGKLYPPEFPTPFGYCPRRTVLDAFLVDAARAAGADVVEGFSVTDVLRDGDGRVTGIAGNGGASPADLSARLVVGADGLHSRIARLVGAEEHDRIDSALCGYYSYFSGVDRDCEVWITPGAAAFVFPTTDHRHCIAVITTADRFPQFRTDIDATFAAVLGQASPALARDVGAATQEERWTGTTDVPHFYRQPWGPGWALAGDAGLHVDPTRGFGITKSFNEAEWLAQAITDGIRNGDLDAALERYAQARDRAGAVYTERNLKWARFVSGQNDESAFAREGLLPLGPLAEWAA